MYLIVGLGNPEKKYENTRHNVGFDAIDLLSEQYMIPVETKKHRALIGQGVIQGEKFILAKPQTYMNLSGESIREIVEYYDIPVENVVVLCDDVYLDIGVLRIREKGSAGGHNGLKNIILHLATEDFKRIRIGVGKQPEHMDLVEFVLSKFTATERKMLADVYQDAAKAAVGIFKEGVANTMSKYNGNRLA